MSHCFPCHKKPQVVLIMPFSHSSPVTCQVSTGPWHFPWPPTVTPPWPCQGWPWHVGQGHTPPGSRSSSVCRVNPLAFWNLQCPNAQSVKETTSINQLKFSNTSPQGTAFCLASSMSIHYSAPHSSKCCMLVWKSNTCDRKLHLL